MRLKFIRRDRGSFSGDLLLVLADCRPVRGEAVRGGAGNGCYGKSVHFLISLKYINLRTSIDDDYFIHHVFCFPLLCFATVDFIFSMYDEIIKTDSSESRLSAALSISISSSSCMSFFSKDARFSSATFL